MSSHTTNSHGGSAAMAISNAMVQIVAKYTGRGPTKARTTLGRDNVVILLADTLTKGERTLVDAGFCDEVLASRRGYQQAMRSEATQMIQNLTGRTVIGFMSDNHFDPDLGAEIFVLEQDGSSPAGPDEADSTD